jgi:hypothetical protein
MPFIELIHFAHYSLPEFSQSFVSCTRGLAWMAPMTTHMTNVVTQLVLMDNVVCPHQIQCKPQFV